MTRALILCAGDATRWNGYLGVRKQLVTVDGEPLLHRTVRLLRERGIGDIRIIVKPGDEQQFAVDGAIVEVAKLNPRKFEADRFYSSRRLWNTDGRTLILYGDVWYSDAAMNTIAADDRPGWQVYGRPRGSKLTGCRHGELFALSWWPAQHAEVDAKLDQIVRLQAARIINRSLGWELFRALCGRSGSDVRRSRGTPFERMVVVDDWTDDFDKPADYEEWTRRRNAIRPAKPVSVLVPFRSDGEHRDKAWAYVQNWWARTHPDWQVVVGTCQGPWVKAYAIADALTRATGDVLVLADADVICDGVGEAVRQVAHGTAPWAIPHHEVRRLSRRATEVVLAGTSPSPSMGGLDQRPYRGVEGGGMVVLPRGDYEQVPLDPRFQGWGQEDSAGGVAWRTLLGKPWRGQGTLWHLWHPPAPRLNRHVGSQDGWALYVRYEYAAKSGPGAVRRLISEFEPIRS
jgi:hypothetical protein